MNEMFIFFKIPVSLKKKKKKKKTIVTEALFTKIEMINQGNVYFLEIWLVFKKYQDWSSIY